MKQQYKRDTMRGESRKVVEIVNSVIEDYTAQGFTLSVRQLYYQLVARDYIPNTEASYKRIAGIINDGRLMGLIDWNAIEDRNRDIEIRSRWDSGADIVLAAAQSFHMDLWQGQPYRLFVIVEKAALAGVLDRVCREYDVPLLAARGYPSVSIVRELALQHLVPAINNDQTPIILHLGDHDPSGIDMTRDLRERLDMFVEAEFELGAVDVNRMALNMDQIHEKSPPPNPAKTTDSRFGEYRSKFGDESWELDALEPSYLVDLVREAIRDRIEWDQWEDREAEIEGIRKKLNKVAKAFA